MLSKEVRILLLFFFPFSSSFLRAEGKRITHISENDNMKSMTHALLFNIKVVFVC